MHNEFAERLFVITRTPCTDEQRSPQLGDAAECFAEPETGVAETERHGEREGRVLAQCRYRA